MSYDGKVKILNFKSVNKFNMSLCFFIIILVET